MKVGELTYSELAAELEVTPRYARVVVAQHHETIQPVIYSHKKRRFLRRQVEALKRKLRKLAIQRGQA